MTDAAASTPPEATRLHVPIGVELGTWFFRAASIGLSMGGGHLIGEPLGIAWPASAFTGAMVLLTFISLDTLQRDWRVMRAVSTGLLVLFYVVGQAWNIYTDLSGAQLGLSVFIDQGEAEIVRDQADQSDATSAQAKFDRAVAAEQRAEQALASIQDDIAGIIALRDRPVEERDSAYALDVRQLQGRLGVKPDGRIGEDTGRAIDLLVRDLRTQETPLLIAYLDAQKARETAKTELDTANAKVKDGAGSDVSTLASKELTESERAGLPIFIAFVIELLSGTLKLAFGRRVPVSDRTGVLSKLRRPRFEPADMSAARPPTRPDLMPLASAPADDSWRRPMGEIDRATTEAAAAAAAADRRASEAGGAPTVAASSALVARTLRRKGASDHRYSAKELRDPNAALRLRGRNDNQGGKS